MQWNVYKVSNGYLRITRLKLIGSVESTTVDGAKRLAWRRWPGLTLEVRKLLPNDTNARL